MKLAMIVESPDLEATQEQPLESVLHQLDEVRRRALIDVGLVVPEIHEISLLQRQAE